MTPSGPVADRTGAGCEAVPVWCLMGPTASGKTDLAIELCRRFPFEIVSADASQVYRGLDIGTAKPEPRVRQAIRHHLIDIRTPQQTYSAAEFLADAEAAIGDIVGRGRIPLLVGGTMFYLRAFELGLPAAPSADRSLRRGLERRAEREGWAALHGELARLDPERARCIEPADKQRIMRALEVVMLTGRPSASVPFQRRSAGRRFLCKLVLAPADRAWLHRRIEHRFLSMLEAGLVDEVRALRTVEKLPPELPVWRMVGYRQVVQFLSGEVEYNDMVRRGIAATRQLAKRQLTWLRNQAGVTWVDSMPRNSRETAVAYVASKLAGLGV